MNVLLVYAQPETTSLTRHLVHIATQVLTAQGHCVVHSDLHKMGWKAVFDSQDFPERINPERFSYIQESAHAFAHGRQTSDVEQEQRKVLASDAVIFLFPLWWFSMPAIMKGWIERVWAYGLAYGYQNKGNAYRYGEGGFKGKRALLAVSIGGPERDYSPRGINGDLAQLLFPITHGTLFYTGMEVLPTFAVYGSGQLYANAIRELETSWRSRLENLFNDAPIPFRSQNSGEYPDRHVLAEHIAPGMSGLAVHLEDD
ncbi:NAD(P)H-dependent oxidoreductase [Enterobacter cloacae complex sp. 2022EL-00788]|uniref:NAD(P)H-dependent oxidoreductase n=1 Tax=Enterobacter cloacae complex sp. 2022EL-00788 TaxID=2996512 RepID=UPI002270ECE4|nr:NAD(P)H-dependent oxidoreductase [Enterobacter cloacae complex sp. 2022EL-00788]MCY0774869.1 NAD(P)H-dependent oxidoreductase [Enterobacter cloacae complex sp. 2022EL-00788]